MADDDNRAVLEAVQRRADALAAADVSALGALLHRQFHWTSHLGETFDRDAYTQANTGRTLVWQQQTMSGVTVEVVADTAVVIALATDEVIRGGRPERFQMPMTQTWVRTDGRWICLAGHAGPIRTGD